jgi:hypothetical protein
MANETINSLAKVLAGSTSRRRALKGFAAVGAGGLLTLIGRQQTAAEKCRPNQQKIAGECYPRPFVRTHEGGGKPDGESPGQAKQ